MIVSLCSPCTDSYSSIGRCNGLIVATCAGMGSVCVHVPSTNIRCMWCHLCCGSMPLPGCIFGIFALVPYSLHCNVVSSNAELGMQGNVTYVWHLLFINGYVIFRAYPWQLDGSHNDKVSLMYVGSAC